MWQIRVDTRASVVEDKRHTLSRKSTQNFFFRLIEPTSGGHIFSTLFLSRSHLLSAMEEVITMDIKNFMEGRREEHTLLNLEYCI